ncbi:actin-1/3 [Plakobranchus ocellatus]|uniref:Actin-1/3 n=1 Tax=Plakobranchus ocellatus TaxID=259542 RepID=A0AAV4CGF8_9GAST|nr:actin-1/3 [Plakobranchus ocellatus]
MRPMSTSGVVVLPVSGCYARFPADFVDFVGDGCSTRTTSTLEILRNTFSIDKNATQNASWVGQGSRSIKETNSKKKRWQPATVIPVSHQGIQHLIKSAEREALLCGDATVNMRDLPDTYASVDTDMTAYELMRRNDIRGRPLLTPGDGNCPFNSISIILIRNTQIASEWRYKTCIQMATRKDRVLEGLRNIDDLFIVSPDYDESLIACARATEFSSAWTILGLSQVLQHKVISVYPSENGPCDETVRILTTEFGSFQHELSLSILSMGPKKGKGKMWLPNHFLPNTPESSDDDAAHDDEKQTEDGVCGGCDDDVLNDDGNFYEVDDDHADNGNNEIDNNRRDGEEEETIEVTSSPVVLHDGDETETDD